ncbi:MAG: LptF/LptG family permease, partial [Bacteriovoracaceae bacterium]
INGFMRNYSASRVALEYFLKMPDLMGKMLPISALLASLFSFNKLKSHSELMAILAGGFSAGRIYALITGCAISIAIVQFVNLGFVLPTANKIKRQEFEKSRKSESKYLARSQIGGSGLVWYKSKNYFTSFSAYDSRSEELKNVTVYFQNEQGRLQQVFKAHNAKFLGPGEWLLENAQVLSKLDADLFPSSLFKDSLTLPLEEEPSDFDQFEADITTLDFFDLASFINRLKRTGIDSSEYEIMLYEKLSLALICIVFALFPVSSIFVPNRRAAGFGKSVVITLVFSVVFWLIYSSVISFGNAGKVPPLLATMGIPCFFAFYIVWVFRKNRSL